MYRVHTGGGAGTSAIGSHRDQRGGLDAAGAPPAGIAPPPLPDA
jgi:hypothetical protein